MAARVGARLDSGQTDTTRDLELGLVCRAGLTEGNGMQQAESRRVRLAVLLLGLLGFGLTTVQAAIHPDAIRQAAPEILKLTVDKVQIAKDESVDDGPGKIVIIAQVMEVQKSLTKLRPGDVITIRYERYLKAEARALKSYEARMSGGMVGAQFFHEPDIPADGDLLMAYLEPDDDEAKRRAKIYHPRAHQYSFVILKSKTAN